MQLYKRLAQPQTSTPGWEALFPRAPLPEEGDLWKNLEAKLRVSSYIPRPLGDVEAHQVAERGKMSWVLKRKATNSYIRLSEEDYFIWSQMDGQKTCLQITIAFMKEYKQLALGRVAGLVDILSSAGLLEGGKPDLVYSVVREKLAKRGYRAWLSWLMQTFIFREVAITGFGKGIDIAYRRFVWLFYTRPMLALYAVLSVVGLGVYLFGPQSSLTMPATTSSMIKLVGMVLGVLLVHECGHAFTVKAFGREVNRGGLFLMFGMPGAFVDTTDMWLAPKHARLAVTAAGPIVHLIFGGGAALLSLILPQATVDLHRFAFVNYLLILVNLTPFIKLDGYYLVMDWLEIANLRERAVAFAGREFWLKIRRSWAAGEWFPRFSREETILVVFGGISSLYTFYFIYYGMFFLPIRLFEVFEQFQALNFRSLAAIGGLVSIAFTLAFGAAQVLMTTDRLFALLKRLSFAVQNTAIWQGVLLIAGVALTISSIPTFLQTQARGVQAAEAWAIALPVLACLLASGLAGHLMAGMRGSPWRWGYAGLTVSSLGFAVSFILERTLGLIALPMRGLLTGLAILGLLPIVRVWFQTLRGSIGGAWLLLASAISLLLAPNAALSRLGAVLLLGGVFLAWQLIHRPLPPPLRPLEMTADETDPERQGMYLGFAFAWLLEATLQQTVEILGQPSQARLIETFNRATAGREHSLWFNARGVLTDQEHGTPWERGRVYRETLAVWLEQLSQEIESQFAADALLSVYYELPMRLRRLVSVHLLEGLAWNGPAPWQAEEAGDRIKLKLAFSHLAERTFLGFERIYGRGLSERVLDEFNRVAAGAEWGLWFRANGRLSINTEGNLHTLTEIFQSALADLLGNMAFYTGKRFVEQCLLQAHDSLPWQLREVAAPELLRYLPWARKLQKGDVTLREFLREAPAFRTLPAEVVAQLAAKAKPERLPAGKRLHRAGATLRWARLIRTGRVGLELQDEKIAHTLEAGEIVAREEILQNRPAASTARALSTVDLICLPAQLFAQLLREAAPQSPEVHFLSRIPLFRTVPPEALGKLAKMMEPRSVLEGEKLVRRGELGTELYLIYQGEFAVSVPDSQGQEHSIAHLGPGEFFGEMALLHKEPRTATVQAITNAQVWSLSAEAYAAFLREIGSLQMMLEQVSSRRRLELRSA
ncbi:MAG: hypothetical protein Fur0022_20790 [Anaerolineales bacterium]